MSPFEELEQELDLKREDGDFPDGLAEEIGEVLAHPERFAAAGEEVRHLAEQVRCYDAYAGAGCFSDSFGPEDIRRTLRKLMKPS